VGNTSTIAPESVVASGSEVGRIEPESEFIVPDPFSIFHIFESGTTIGATTGDATGADESINSS